MNTNPAMLANIARNRFDHLPRLVYADWLDEQSDDTATRTAEFIRVGVALVDMPQQHRASDVCDCDRCRLVRRQTELFDAGAAVVYPIAVDLYRLGFDEIYQPLVNYTGGFVDHFRAEFRSGHVLTSLDLNRLAHAVGETFRLMPVGSVSIRFRNRRTSRGEVLRHSWNTWQVDVVAQTTRKENSFRVCALVGPVSNGRVFATFTCEYLTNHVKRIPHLARVAARRSLFNRHDSKETRRTPPPRPLPPQHPNCRSSVAVVRRESA